jgi:hypothetical protein
MWVVGIYYSFSHKVHKGWMNLRYLFLLLLHHSMIWLLYLTNAFLVTMNDLIALWYNDKIVPESHHDATIFLTMKVITCLF